MSDYFGALIRASGMAVEPGLPVRAPERLPASVVGEEHGLIELDLQREALPPAPPMPLPAAPPTPPVRTHAVSDAPPAGVPRQSEAPPPAMVAAAAPAVAAMEAVITPTARPPAPAPERPAPAPLPQTLSEEAASAPSAHPDLGAAMVRAAMQWVAAVPPHPATSPEAMPQPRPTSPQPAVETSIRQTESPTAPPEIVEEIRQAPRAEALPTPNSTPLIRVAPSQPVEAIARPALRAMALTHPAPHEEVVEVSIGAIHLRVDAPAVQAAAPPSAPTAKTRPSTDRAPDRSGLARRALRRI